MICQQVNEVTSHKKVTIYAYICRDITYATNILNTNVKAKAFERIGLKFILEKKTTKNDLFSRLFDPFSNILMVFWDNAVRTKRACKNQNEAALIVTGATN